ncbi:aminoacyl-tRNA hydrolase [candidate division KSB1 bacterium]|nr:aminoacyl-tRNA hydrolase [candidate division KSB1 bacterium]
MPSPFLIAGLGNPGRKYRKTRHNIGFMVIDEMAESSNTGFKSQKLADIAGVQINGNTAYLVKPMTYMNESGLAVRSIRDYYNITPENVVVVYDDIDLPFGRLRIRGQGGSGGHKGVASIINHLGSNEFTRVRIGIKPDHPVKDVVQFVLSPFSRQERKNMEETIAEAITAVNIFVVDGLNKSMNIFNTPKNE